MSIQRLYDDKKRLRDEEPLPPYPGNKDFPGGAARNEAEIPGYPTPILPYEPEPEPEPEQPNEDQAPTAGMNDLG